MTYDWNSDICKIYFKLLFMSKCSVNYVDAVYVSDCVVLHILSEILMERKLRRILLFSFPRSEICWRNSAIKKKATVEQCAFEKKNSRYWDTLYVLKGFILVVSTVFWSGHVKISWHGCMAKVSSSYLATSNALYFVFVQGSVKYHLIRGLARGGKGPLIWQFVEILILFDTTDF